MQSQFVTMAHRTLSAWRARPWFNLFVVGALALSVWWWRPLWLHGPAPSYSVLADLARAGQADARLYDDGWYSAQVLARTNGAVSDVFTPSLPTLPTLIAPLAFVPTVALPFAWAVVNVLTLWLALRAPLPLFKNRSYLFIFVVVIALALFSAPLYENLERGQLYLGVLWLHALLFAAVLRRRDALGGIALGVLFALKTTGLPFWVVLLALRRWRALASGVITIGAVMLLTVFVSGADIWRVYVTQVLPGALGSSLATVPAFQTVSGFFQHLFRYDAQWNPSPLWDAPLLATAATALASLALLGVTWARANRVPLPQLLAAGSVLSVCLMPLAEQYHYLVLLLPFGVAVASFARFNLAARVVLGLSIVCVFAPLPFKNPQWWNGAWALLAYPRLYGALSLWALLVFTKSDAN